LAAAIPGVIITVTGCGQRESSLEIFMDSEELELNRTLAETDSAKTEESVQVSRPEIPVDEHPLYLRSRQIAFRPQVGDLGR
jgi:hypothetical protein